MIRDIDEYKEAFKKQEMREYAKLMADAWLSGRDTKKINEIHRKFQEDIENDEFVNKMFLKYLQDKMR